MRKLIWKFLKWILFQFDAETAHRITLRMIHMGHSMADLPLIAMSGGPVTREDCGTEVLGMEFLSRVGLAAGFDKDAEILGALPALGFGFAEIGTVTPRPQPGNPRPRLFRDVENAALFNRMGFNSLGATIVSEHLKRVREKLPASFRVGVNIGKNKDTALEEAHLDYALAIKSFENLADYVVINISSPNTPGLRSLQTVENIRKIVSSVDECISRWQKTPPLLLKLAPEVQADEMAAIMKAAEDAGVSGWVLTNTWAGEFQSGLGKLSGGFSGSTLIKPSYEALVLARGLTRRPIISVGGIMTVQEAERRISAGADLLQVYSGWIFSGPTFPGELSRKIGKPRLLRAEYA